MGSSSTRPDSARGRLPAGLLSVAALLALWQGASHAAGDPALFPAPLAVAQAVLREAEDGALFVHLGATLARVAAAFAIAMAVGTALGLLMGMRPRLDAFADPWLVVFLNLPALVTIVLCYIWIGLTEAAAIAAVAINKIPLVTAMMREGARALDPGLAAMAQVFGMGRWARLRHVVLPQLAPHLASAGRSGLALVWKIVLVVEFLGRSSGVGFMIHLHFQLFDVTTVLAYAVSFILVMLAIEKGVLQPWERRAARWRGERA
jgi:NitT/TauT family transport system permease protein